VFNGFLTSAPSHRARIPATAAFGAPTLATTDCGLNVRTATYARRTAIDPTPGGCNATYPGSCSNATGRVWIEQRWYAHRAIPSLMVMEVQLLTQDTYHGMGSGGGTADDGMYVQAVLTNFPGPASPDLDLQPVTLSPTAPYAIVNGSTLVGETNSSGLQAVAVLTSVTSGTYVGNRWTVPFTSPNVTVLHVSARERAGVGNATPAHA
jgi:hypothetical protein